MRWWKVNVKMEYQGLQNLNYTKLHLWKCMFAYFPIYRFLLLIIIYHPRRPFTFVEGSYGLKLLKCMSSDYFVFWMVGISLTFSSKEKSYTAKQSIEARILLKFLLLVNWYLNIFPGFVIESGTVALDVSIIINLSIV